MKYIIFLSLPVALALPLEPAKHSDGPTLNLPTSALDFRPDPNAPCSSYPGYDAVGNAAMNLFFLPEVDGSTDQFALAAVPLSDSGSAGRLILDSGSSSAIPLQCLDSSGLQALIPTLKPQLPSTFPSLRFGNPIASPQLFMPLRIITSSSSQPVGSLTYDSAPDSGSIAVEAYPLGTTPYPGVTPSTAVYLGAEGCTEWAFQRTTEGKYDMRLLVPEGPKLRKDEVRGRLKVWRCPEGYVCGEEISNDF